MPTSVSRLAYDDCFKLMDKALEQERGLRIPFDEYGDGFRLRLRCHTARVIDRTDNAETYPGPDPDTGNAGHPLHGRSIYDDLVIKLRRKGDKAIVDIEIISKMGYNAEPLPPVGEETAASEAADTETLGETLEIASPVGSSGVRRI